VKDLSELHVCVIDAGTFVPLADMMGRACKRASYYSPWEQEFVAMDRCMIGNNMAHFERVDDYMEPEFFDSVSLWVFPDIGFGGFQRYLRRLGKPVWGSIGASDLELFRTRFIKTVKDVGLPVVPSVTLRGLTALSEHLKSVENKWVKINRYRDDMETWKHIDWQHSQREMERLALKWGPMKEYPVFVVQDEIKDEEDGPVLEIGFDGWMVTDAEGNPRFPSKSYQGYEKKNQLYLGSLLDYDALPAAVQVVNEKLAPVLAEYGYRNFWATEIRQKDGIPYFIDPTARMAGQTMEHLLKTCTNLPQVIWKGSHGEIVEPEFDALFAAEATLHYTGAGGDTWKTLKVPESIEDKVALYRCCLADGAYQFPPHKSDELGVISGTGDTIEESINDLKDAFEELKSEPVSIELAGFADLIEEINKAEAEGAEFTEQEIPSPEIAIKN
jgi:hypothetical protein